MMSDDTEHALMVAQSLLAQPDDAEAFARDFSWRLRGWILALPAGVGFATLRASMKLCLGASPAKSGVCSAGNGAAMRSAVLGACLGDDPEKLRRYVRACTRITHTDPRAERGALAVALAAHHGRAEGCLAYVVRSMGAELDDELRAALEGVGEGTAWDPGRRGVSGYVYATVPAALAAFLRHPGDFRGAVQEAVGYGGDTDTVAAITGALAGISSHLPEDWLAGLRDWPRSTTWIREVACRLRRTFVDGERPGPAPLAWWGLPLRNAVFLATILAHGFRRLAPPY